MHTFGSTLHVPSRCVTTDPGSAKDRLFYADSCYGAELEKYNPAWIGGGCDEHECSFSIWLIFQKCATDGRALTLLRLIMHECIDYPPPPPPSSPLLWPDCGHLCWHMGSFSAYHFGRWQFLPPASASDGLHLTFRDWTSGLAILRSVCLFATTVSTFVLSLLSLKDTVTCSHGILLVWGEFWIYCQYTHIN